MDHTPFPKKGNNLVKNNSQAVVVKIKYKRDVKQSTELDY